MMGFLFIKKQKKQKLLEFSKCCDIIIATLQMLIEEQYSLLAENDNLI